MIKAGRNGILKFIEAIRDSFGGSEIVYTHGSCYKFYEILKVVFPDAEAYYDHNHVITKIGRYYYDINGQVPMAKAKDPSYRPYSQFSEYTKDFYAKHKFEIKILKK